MSTVAEELRRYDVGLSEADVADELGRAFAGLPGAGSAPLTATEVSYLAEHAGGPAAQVAAGFDPAATRRHRAGVAAQSVQRLAVGTVSIDRAAELLGVDRSRISHRLSEGSLYAVPMGSRRRIPAWQIHQGRDLPGLATIVAAIPPRAHPLDVAGVMTTPQDELNGRTPLAHLAGHGDPQPVAELLADLGRW